MNERDSKQASLIGRRGFLSTTAKVAASVAVASALPNWVRAEATRLPFPFTLGVASGDPLPNAVVLWTRLAPAPLEPTGGMGTRPEVVFWQVACDEQFRRIERSGVTLARAERGHSVHVDVRGLDAARTYYYRFWAGGHYSPVGRTRTAPDYWRAHAYDVRFAFASCQHFEQGFYTAYKHMAEEDLDFVVFLGDYIYEGVPVEGRPRRHNDGGEPTTIEGYRQRYGLYKGDPNLQLAHARFPWIVTWDDHEVDNDYSDEIPQDPDLQSRDVFVARRAAAYQAYWEHMPLRAVAEPSGPDMQLYRRLSYGPLALNVLDTRQYRSVTKPCGVATGPICEALLDPSRTILGAEQEEWLLSGLHRSRARWNVLAQQVPFGFTDMGQTDVVEVRQDKWDAYPVARQRVVDFMAQRKIQNPVVLTGDLHNAWLTVVNRNVRDPSSQPVATEFTGTSITSGGDGSDQTATAPTVLAKNPQVLFNSNRRGYISCEINEQTWTSHYRVVPFVASEGAPLETAKSFVVESGDPVAYPA